MSESKFYRIIRQLNSGLDEKHYIATPGKAPQHISQKNFMEYTPNDIPNQRIKKRKTTRKTTRNNKEQPAKGNGE